MRMTQKSLFAMTVICLLLSIPTHAVDEHLHINQNTNVRWRLYPTQNFSTFLQLDTMTGQIMQLHFPIGDKGYSGALPLNTEHLAIKTTPTIGRFTLYPTANMYNFILLDQISGLTWLVQWNFDEKNRLIIPLNSKLPSKNISLGK